MVGVTMRLTTVRALLCTLAALALLAPLPAAALELDSISKAAASYTVGDPKLESMYRTALLHNGQQITLASDGTTYVTTGDIPAEWLRDASAPVAYTGMIWTGFRPSDDACTYNFLIPSEMMAVVSLGQLEEIERVVYHNVIKAQRAKALRNEVQNGIQTWGVQFTPNYGYVYAYEVDFVYPMYGADSSEGTF